METFPRSPADRPPIGRGSPSTRSRVSNGASLLPGIDGRSMTARRYKNISSAICADQGGAEHLSETRIQLIRRFAAASCLAEAMEARLVNGETVDIQEHALLVWTAVRCVQRIGIDRHSRNITPALADYIDEEDDTS